LQILRLREQQHGCPPDPVPVGGGVTGVGGGGGGGGGDGQPEGQAGNVESLTQAKSVVVVDGTFTPVQPYAQ